jgi:hypothetical protein
MTRRTRSGRTLLLVAFALAFMLVMTPAVAAHGQPDLAEVRRATAKYQRLEVAEADGYSLGYEGVVTGCVAHPTDGAMGYHYFNKELFEDPTVDPLRPAGLVYAPGPNGQRKLVAVEWVVPKSIWEGAGNTGAPTVLGMDMHILNPVLNWYIHHAWVWKHNPSGIFQDWNPEIVCPPAP